MNRQVNFVIDGGDPADTITMMLLDLHPEAPGNSIRYDQADDGRHTVAWRIGAGWAVSFRPVAGDPTRSAYYRNPVDAARAVVYREHNGGGRPLRARPSETPAETGCAGLTAGPADQCPTCTSSGLTPCVRVWGANVGEPLHGGSHRSIKNDHTNRPTTLVGYDR